MKDLRGMQFDSIDTVIFDLDGTLLDTLGDLTVAVNYALRRYSLSERTKQEVRAFLGNGYRALIAKAVPKECTDDIVSAVHACFKSYYENNCSVHTAPYQGIMQVLRQLKACGVKVAIVSNKGNAAVKVLADKYFRGLVAIAVGESPEIRRKPHPDMVLAAIEQMGSRAEKCVYIGDSEVDFETAKRAGIPSLICLWGFRDKQQLSGYGMNFINTPEEILTSILPFK